MIYKLILKYSIAFVLFLSCNFSFANIEAEDSSINIIVIYPHFYSNTRTLIHSLDSIMNTCDDDKFFVYVSSEFNPRIYSKTAQIPDFIKEISVSYGDLVPNFKFDEKNIRENLVYKKLLSEENIDTLNYFFFIPVNYVDYYIKAIKKGDLNAKSNYLGIIPKSKIQMLENINITIYFPKGQWSKAEIIINEQSIKTKDI